MKKMKNPVQDTPELRHRGVLRGEHHSYGEGRHYDEPSAFRDLNVRVVEFAGRDWGRGAGLHWDDGGVYLGRRQADTSLAFIKDDYARGYGEFSTGHPVGFRVARTKKSGEQLE